MTVSFGALRGRFAAIPEVWVATRDAEGAPHVVPRWFVWREDGLWIACDRDSRTWANAEVDPRVGVAGDLGTAWADLAGFTLQGKADLLRAEDVRMREPISAWHEKYRNLLLGEGFERLTTRIERLGFLRIEAEEVRTWDHAGPTLPVPGGDG